MVPIATPFVAKRKAYLIQLFQHRLVSLDNFLFLTLSCVLSRLLLAHKQRLDVLFEAIHNELLLRFLTEMVLAHHLFADGVKFGFALVQHSTLAQEISVVQVLAS